MTATQDRFYITGGTLPLDADSYVVRQADTVLFSSLKRGDFCYVLNTRQMGKSSLMIRTARQLNQESGEGVVYRTVVLDLASIGKNVTLPQWYQGMIVRIAEQLDRMDELIDRWRADPDLGPLQRFMDTLLHAVALLQPRIPSAPPVSLVIFVDEIDMVRSLPFSADELFVGIRECYNRRVQDPLFQRLTFCLLGVANPTDLISDPRLSPFNIGERVPLADFTPAEAALLARGLEADRAEATGARLLERVLYWTGGHPYLTQRLCRAVAESGLQSTSEESVDQLCAALFLTRTALQTDDNLSFIRNRLLRSDEDVAALLERYGQVRAGRKVKDDETDPLCGVLRLSGIVRNEQGVLKVRNQIYGQVFDAAWIAAHTPDAELRRQRAAYRRGLLRAATIGTGLAAVLATLAGVALFQAERAEHSLTAIKAERARTQRLASQLSGTLSTLTRTNSRLKDALQTATLQTQRAQTAAQKAATAQKQSDLQRHLALVHAGEARSARQEAMYQREITVHQLSRAYVSASLKQMEEGDRFGALAPLSAAMQLDRNDPEREAMHRRRFAAALWNAPHLRKILVAGAPLQSAMYLPDGVRLFTADKDGGMRLWDLAHSAPLRSWKHPGAIWYAELSPNGRQAVSAGQDGVTRLWDTETGKELQTLRQPGGIVRYAGFSPQGDRILTTGRDGAVLWSAATGRPLGEISRPRGIGMFAAFSPDGGKVVLLCEGFLACVADAYTGNTLCNLPECYGGVRAQFSPTGDRIVVAGLFEGQVAYRGAVIYDGGTGRQLRRFESPSLGVDACFSPNGKQVLTTGRDQAAMLWDAETGRRIAGPLRHQAAIIRGLFDPTGRSVLTVGEDGAARLWDTQTGALQTAPLRHADALATAVFSPDGRTILTAGRDRTVRVWELPGPVSLSRPLTDTTRLSTGIPLLQGRRVLTTLFIRPHKNDSFYVQQLYNTETGRPLFPQDQTGEHWIHYVLSRDQTRIALISPEKVQVFNTLTGQSVGAPIRYQSDRPLQMRLSPDGRTVAVIRRGESVQVFSAETARALTAPFSPAAFEAFYTPDSRRLLVTTQTGSVRLWDIQTGLPLSAPLLHDDQVQAAAFSLSGRLVFTWTVSGWIRVWDLRTHRLVGAPILQDHPNPEVSFTVSPDGHRLITPGRDGEEGILWDVDTGRPLPAAPGASLLTARQVVFSPDGGRLVTLGDTARIWNAHTGRPLSPILPHRSRVNTALFSQDSRRLVTSSDDSTAVVWDADTGIALTPPMRHDNSVRWAQFAHDDRFVVTASSDGTARLWDAATGEALSLPYRLLDEARRAWITPDGNHLITVDGQGVLLWPLENDTRPLTDLIRQAALLSGR